MVDSEGTGVEPFTETVEKKSTDKGRLKIALLVTAIIAVVFGLFFIFGGLKKKEKVKPVPGILPSPTQIITEDKSVSTIRNRPDVPVFDLSGPTEAKVNDKLKYDFSARAGKGVLTKVDVWVAKTGGKELDEWKYKCPGEIKENWCNLITNDPAKSEENISIDWIPEEAGTYFITANILNSEKGECAGILFAFTPGLDQCAKANPVILSVK